MSKAGEGILRGLKQAIAFANGTAKKGAYVVHIPPEIDVKAIRGRLGLTQQRFAVRFGFNIKTLRLWEQGRLVPEGPTRAYLKVIDREPKAVKRALRIESGKRKDPIDVSLSRGNGAKSGGDHALKGSANPVG
jgi:putative transcriptional regulator